MTPGCIKEEIIFAQSPSTAPHNKDNESSSFPQCGVGCDFAADLVERLNGFACAFHLEIDRVLALHLCTLFP